MQAKKQVLIQHSDPQQTAFDTLAYAAGATDEVKGTGVWSGFELKRDNDEEKKDDGEKDDK